jgi:hypothetical protein
MNTWIDIQPGDIGFTKGGGIVGWIIRHGTGSAYAHTFVYHKHLGNGIWETVEAWPSTRKNKDGVRVRTRTEAPIKVARIWRTRGEQDRILKHSESMIGTRYGWGEILRIALRFVGIKVNGWESTKRAICSNHCTASVLASRPSLSNLFRYSPSLTWPGELATTVDGAIWLEQRINDKKRGK